jgi:GTP cyclohydrolase III
LLFEKYAAAGWQPPNAMGAAQQSLAAVGAARDEEKKDEADADKSGEK